MSDGDCGAGFLYDPSASALLCEGATCDIDGVAADKTACCVAQASCGDSDGEGAGTASVSTADCATHGLLYLASAADSLCDGPVCDVVGNANDKALCCGPYTDVPSCLADLDAGGTACVVRQVYPPCWM